MDKNLWKNPGPEFTETPLWSWNDRLDDRELVRQLDELKKGGWRSFFIHPRCGLRTPYLSREWFRKVKLVVREAEKRGMKAWIYDENVCPSGFAEGIVTARGPRFRLKSLVMRVATRVDRSPETVAVFRCRFRNGLPEKVFADHGETISSDWTYLHFFIVTAPPGDNRFNGMTYPDVLNPEVADMFLKSTYEVYARHLGKWFGKTVPGFFTDEPRFMPGSERFGSLPGLPWTEALPAFFLKQKGYDIRTRLPDLFFDLPTSVQTRTDFWEVVTQRFIDSWNKRIFSWCENHHVILTGHFLYDDWLEKQILSNGAIMPHLQYLHFPGLDQLGSDPIQNWGAGAERGYASVLTVKQAASVAAQLGRKRVFVEAYGVSGQNFSFAERKWIGDWLAVLGCNFFTPHQAHYSLRAGRKRECPPVLFYQQPWWPDNKMMADYFTRLSYCLSQGKRTADILLLHPIRTAWAFFSPLNSEQAHQLDISFKRIQHLLLENHRDFDLGDEDILKHYGKIEGARFSVGEARYRAVIIPPSLNLSSATVDMLMTFLRAGGKLIALKPVPTLVDGKKNSRLSKLFRRADVIEEGNLIKTLHNIPSDVSIDEMTKGQKRKKAAAVWCQLRENGNKLILFLVNTSREKGIKTLISIQSAGRVEEWDLFTGRTRNIECRTGEKQIVIPAVFQPTDSRLFVVHKDQPAPVLETTARPASPQKTRPMPDNWRIGKCSLNALAFNFCDLSLSGGEWKGPLGISQAREEVEKIGIGTIFAVRFAFENRLSQSHRRPVYLVAENPERFVITLNGRRIRWRDSGFWRDVGFRKMRIDRFLSPGRCSLVFSGKTGLEGVSSPCWGVTENLSVEKSFLAGNFTVRPIGQNLFKICELAINVNEGNLTGQGYPFFAGRITLEQDFDLKEEKIGGEICLELGRLDAIVANITVNDRKAAPVWKKPYRTKIAGLLKKGRNRIAVELVNSLHNLLAEQENRAVPFGIGKATLIFE